MGINLSPKAILLAPPHLLRRMAETRGSHQPLSGPSAVRHKIDASPKVKIQSLFRAWNRRKNLDLCALRFHLLGAECNVYGTEACQIPIGQRAQRAMEYPQQYKEQLLNAIHSIDLAKVSQAIHIFKAARSRGRRIFVCGSSGTESMAAQFLSEVVRGASFNQSARFRILALSDELPRISNKPDDLTKDRVFVEQLKNFAEPEDVAMGICGSGNSRNVVNAIEYASWIGCKTIAVTGRDGGKLARLAHLNIKIPVNHLGSIGDAQVIICHMIGYYFIDCENTLETGAESSNPPAASST
jgi:D-sedoheptulose 7-phosphate isomerase